MTVQVEKPLSEPYVEPAPQGSLGTPSKKNGPVNEDLLSPVSKLELARKYAAEAQQKRMEQACDRIVSAKKTQMSSEIKIEQTVSEDGDVKVTGRLSSFAKRVVGVLTTTNDENNASAANAQDVDQETSSPTRQLLRATRNKLNALVSKTDDEDSVPATNYHLKQMGLAEDKVNIYAPVSEQQSELRRRRESAIRSQEKWMQENAEIHTNDDAYKSGDDSDYAGEGDDNEDSDDALSDWEVDQEELRGLIQDQSEFVHNIATLKKYQKAAKRSATLKRIKPVATVAFAIIALLVLALAIAFAEHQSGFCQALVAQSPPAEEARVVTCSAVLRLHDVLESVLSFIASYQ